MAIKKDTLDDLLAGRDPKAVFSKDGLFDELKKALAERVLNAELDDHLDNEAAEGSTMVPAPYEYFYLRGSKAADGLLRHTVYIDLQEDKPTEQVRREAGKVR